MRLVFEIPEDEKENFSSHIQSILNIKKIDGRSNVKSQLNTLGKCVCRIRCDSKRFDASQPYNTTNDSSGTGTGFLLEEEDLYIYTAHHVISNYVDIGVYFDSVSQGERFDVTVVGFSPGLDIAILKLDRTNLKPEQITMLESLPRLKVGNSDRVHQGDDITALGYALGASHLQRSAGIISGRINDPNRLQTDAQINPGNSGGPIVNENNEVVGLVTSGVMFAQGINYASPINEMIILKNRILKNKKDIGRDLGYSFNCVFRQISQETLTLDFYNKDCNSGVLVAGVHEKSNSLLKKGDILCAIKEPNGEIYYEIDMQGNIDIPNIWSDTKLNFNILLDRISISDSPTLGVKVYRSGHDEALEFNTPVEMPLFIYRELHPDTSPVTYFCDGGVVIQMLNEQLMPYTSLGKNYTKDPDVEMYSSIIVSHIIGGSPFSKSDILKPGQCIKSLITPNGEQINVNTLEQLQEAWSRSYSEGMVTLSLRNGSLVSASKDDIKLFNKKRPKNQKNGLKKSFFPQK